MGEILYRVKHLVGFKGDRPMARLWLDWQHQTDLKRFKKKIQIYCDNEHFWMNSQYSYSKKHDMASCLYSPRLDFVISTQCVLRAR